MANETKHSISLAEAMDLTTRFRENRPENLPICETFEKASVLQMLSQENAVSLRIYMGEKENGLVCTVLCAADASGQDILPAGEDGLKDGGDGLILEDGMRCPELCPPDSPLNN